MAPPASTMGPSFGTMNFSTGVESLDTPLPTPHEQEMLIRSADSPPTELHNDVSQDADIFFAIGAPDGFTGIPENAYIVFFLDNAGHDPRALPANAYQISCPLPLRLEEFIIWASRATQMIRIGLMNRGFCGLDLADLRHMLESSETKQLVLHIFDYADVNQLPLPQLQALRFDKLFALLFAGDALEMRHFSELGEALELINPQCHATLLGMNHLPQSTASLLLLGEASGLTCG